MISVSQDGRVQKMGLVKYDNEQKKRFRENLKKFTEEQGLAKTDLADKLGYAYNTVIS